MGKDNSNNGIINKIVVTALGVSVFATNVVSGAVQLRAEIKDAYNKIERVVKFFKDNEQRQEWTHEDDFYQNLSDEEKQAFDNKLKKIFKCDQYKRLSDEQKDDLVNKFVESEKLQALAWQECAEQKLRLEEVDALLVSLSKYGQQLEQQINIFKDCGGAEEEISEIEQKRQSVQAQIKSAEQQKAYLETHVVVRETFLNQESNKNNSKIIIKKINGVYQKDVVDIMIDADVLVSENVGGVDIFSAQNCFYSIENLSNRNIDYKSMLNAIASADDINCIKVCKNKNDEGNNRYFEEIKYSISNVMQYYENMGYEFSVVQSWENDNSKKPEYIIKSNYNKKESFYLINCSDGQYYYQPIQKICPEFWAQLEVEQANSVARDANQKDSKTTGENRQFSADTLFTPHIIFHDGTEISF